MLDNIDARNQSVKIEQLMEYHEYTIVVAASTDKGFGPDSDPLNVLTDEHGIYYLSYTVYKDILN